MFKIKSFKAKLYLAFFVILMLITFLTIFVSYSFKRLGDIVYSTAGTVDVVQETVSVMRLSEDTSKLLAIAPILAASKEESRFHEVSAEVDTLTLNIHNNLDGLHKGNLRIDPQIISDIRENHSALSDSLVRLKKITLSRIKISEDRKIILSEIEKIRNDLADTIEPAVYGITSWSKMFGKRTSRQNAAMVKEIFESDISLIPEDERNNLYRKTRRSMMGNISEMMDTVVRDLSYTLDIKAEGNLMASIVNTASETQTQKGLSDLKQRVKQSLSKYQNAVQIFQKNELSDTNPILSQNIIDIGNRFIKLCEGENSIFFIQDKDIAETEAMDAILSSCREIAAKMRQQVDTVVQKTQADMSKIQKKIFWVTASVKRWVIAINAVVIMATILFAFGITRSISGYLRQITERLVQSSEQITMASTQVHAASRSLADICSNQVSTVKRTSSSLLSISGMTRQNADHAGNAGVLMTEADKIVEKTDGAMKELTRSMSDIIQASKDASGIIKTIDDISFQTNLLALNASVEAARAGKAGLGFAVVANEVRNLAVRSSGAAKDTASMIDSTVEKITDGSEVLLRTNKAFSEMMERSLAVRQAISEITDASGIQVNETESVSQEINELNRTILLTAQSASESASIAADMNDQAEQMKGIVDELNKLMG